VSAPAKGPRALAGALFQVVGPYVVMTAVLLALWQYASHVLNPIFFPSPAKVVSAMVELHQEDLLVDNSVASMRRILSGFLLGSVAAIPIGLLMGMSSIVRRLLVPYVGSLRFIPAIAMVIFAVSWFGDGEVAKVFLIFLATFFIVLLNVEAGVRGIPANRIRGARSLGAVPRQVFWHVVLPSTIPNILVGMRIAMGSAFAVVISAELLSSQSGIGYLMASAQIFLKTERIFVAVVLLGLFGFATDRLFRWLIHAFGGEYVR
jgi:ABC-type nitrate/sulfonate/bicarbonate transport system permease component